ncbi:hypothetical protein KP509_32G059700 [Ceratopteris richardii]|uniref:Uncharacterized protein n=1 Tax=Ceratopteris richardii TaxID=49495 RepID=A0A8T2QVF4_CERRI|nr:hypothetical protein KP509_32G059700 [Ceratopteris richardii]
MALSLLGVLAVVAAASFFYFFGWRDVIRITVAFMFVLTSIGLGWFLAYNLFLYHIKWIREPVQDIFGLRKKPKQSKPITRSLSRLYEDSSPGIHQTDT